MRQAVLVLGVLLGLVATEASASTITWEFRGTVGGGFMAPDVPEGSLFRFLWNFDPSEPNTCGPGEPGIYFGQRATVHLGNLVYTGTGFLNAGARTTSGCASPVLEDMELRFYSWSGPNLTNAHLDIQGGEAGSWVGMFWFQNPADSTFPTTPPPSARFDGPMFFGGEEFTYFHQEVAVSAVPEPSTWLLFGTGLLAVGRRLVTQR